MLLQDFRYALRTMIGHLRPTVVMTLTLAIGIGAATTVFTLLNAVFLKPLPVHDATALVGVYTTDEVNAQSYFTKFPMSYLNYQDLRAHNDLFTGMGAFYQLTMTLTDVGEARPIAVELASEDYFGVLGVNAALGRTFSREEADESTPGRPVAIVSHQMWVNLFGADPQLVGRTIRLNAAQYTVIGVMPPRFKGLVSLASPEQIWLPLAMYNQILPSPLREFLKTRRGIFMSAFGRLKPGITVAQADAAVHIVAGELARRFPDDNRGRGLTVSPIADDAVGVNDRALFTRGGVVLAAVVGFILVIVCLNVANLLLGQSAAREMEMAVRVALGASRWQLVRQMLTESLVLAAVGGAAGVLLASWMLQLLWSLRPAVVPIDAIALTIDWRVLAFTTAVAVVAAVLVGLVPAIRATKPYVSEVLKLHGGTAAASLRRFSAYDLLVVAELAFALLVVVSAGLFVRSVAHAQRINPGFDASRVFVFGFDLGSEHYPAEKGQRYFERAIEEARATPGVELATIASNVPFAGGAVARSVFPDGRRSTNEPPALSNINLVSVDYFQTLRVPLLKGRLLDSFDRDPTRPVAVVNDAAAKRFWRGADPIGKRFNMRGDATLREVVGVVGNTVQYRTGEDPSPVIYMPLVQNYSPAAFLYVRTSGRPDATLPVVQRKVEALDRNIAITNPATLDELIARDLWALRGGAALLSVFGLVALLLAAVGVYGVMSHSVVRRTHEVGIRMALGARGQDIVRMLLGRALLVTAVGLGAGLLIALVASRSARSLLYGLSPVDPISFAGALVILALVALASCYVPARRATRVDPINSLRST